MRRRSLVLQIHNKWLGVSQRLWHRRRRSRKVRRVVLGQRRRLTEAATGPRPLPKAPQSPPDPAAQQEKKDMRECRRQRQEASVCNDAEQFFVTTAERSVFAAVPESAAGRQTTLKTAKRLPPGTDRCRETFLKAGSGPGTVDHPTGTGP